MGSISISIPPDNISSYPLDNLEQVTIAGGTYQDFVIGSPVEDVTGYSITANGGNINIESLLPPNPNVTRSIVLVNANLNGQNRNIRLLHDGTALDPKSKIFTPNRANTYVIREYGSASIYWSVPHQRWLIEDR